MTVELSDLIRVITLPYAVDFSVLDAQPQPQCTPKANLGALNFQMGMRDVQALMQLASNPADFAAIGALVRHHVTPQGIQVDGPAKLSLDQSHYPASGQRCVPGSLRVKGDLSIVAPLVVCGDLRVDGLLRDCGPQSTLVVLGDLHVGALQTTGEIWVLGSLTAQRYVWGHYNDNVLEVTGRIWAPLVLSDDHSIEALFEVEHPAPSVVLRDSGESMSIAVFDLRDDDHLAALRLVTPPQAWDNNERFDICAFEALSAGG